MGGEGKGGEGGRGNGEKGRNGMENPISVRDSRLTVPDRRSNFYNKSENKDSIDSAFFR
jgi:hypothetical protein